MERNRFSSTLFPPRARHAVRRAPALQFAFTLSERPSPVKKNQNRQLNLPCSSGFSIVHKSADRPVAANFQFLKISVSLGQLPVGACPPQALLGSSTANWKLYHHLSLSFFEKIRLPDIPKDIPRHTPIPIPAMLFKTFIKTTLQSIAAVIPIVTPIIILLLFISLILHKFRFIEPSIPYFSTKEHSYIREPDRFTAYRTPICKKPHARHLDGANMGLEVSLAYSGTRNRSWQAAAVSSLESCFTNARLRENRFFILPR